LQLLTAICDEGDGLTLHEELSQCYDCTHCQVTSKVLLWRIFTVSYVLSLPLFFSLSVFLCLVFVVGSVASQ
jgi:hypothetical protein